MIRNYAMKQHGSALWGRKMGREIRADVEEALEKLRPGEVLGIDLDNIEVMDFSFASEVFGKLISRLPTEYRDRYLVLLNVDDYVEENLDAALNSLELAALILRDSDWKIIGKFSEAHVTTLKALAKTKTATAPQIAEALNISLTACNNRLRKLSDLVLIRKERFSSPTGGEQFQYAWLV